MEQGRQQDLIHRPTLSARHAQLKGWLSKDRLRVAWQLAKTELAKTSSYPSQELAYEIGVERGTIYRWLNGKHKPTQLSFVRIDAAFSQVLGDRWMQRVDRALT